MHKCDWFRPSLNWFESDHSSVVIVLVVILQLVCDPKMYHVLFLFEELPVTFYEIKFSLFAIVFG